MTTVRQTGGNGGGAVAINVYGHLRAQRSVAMAQKVTFSNAQPENGVQMPQQTPGAPQYVQSMDMAGAKTAPPAAPPSQSSS